LCYTISIESIKFLYFYERIYTMWTTPQATEMRFGFEVTMYVMNK
jgi:coenzyme PQQ precursor peptide PqqA